MPSSLRLLVSKTIFYEKQETRNKKPETKKKKTGRVLSIVPASGDLVESKASALVLFIQG